MILAYRFHSFFPFLFFLSISLLTLFKNDKFYINKEKIRREKKWLKKAIPSFNDDKKKQTHVINNLMGECNTVLSAYTKYRHLGYCCTHPPNCSLYLAHCFLKLCTPGSVVTNHS